MYILSGIFNTVSLELFVLFFLQFLCLFWFVFFSGSSDKTELVTLYLKEGEYVIDSQVQRVGTQIMAANYAYTKDKTICFY